MTPAFEVVSQFEQSSSSIGVERLLRERSASLGSFAKTIQILHKRKATWPWVGFLLLQMCYNPQVREAVAAGSGGPMVAYRLYCMDGLGKIGHVEELLATDDQEAVRMAFEKRLPVTCEVWDRDRCVAIIPPHPDA